MVNNSFLDALVAHYDAEAQKYRATLTLYLNEPLAVADHSDILEELKLLTKGLADAEEASATLKRHFPVV